MCGIVGYIGHQPACPILIKGLKRLEYRGYDSSGIAVLQNGIDVSKKKGKVSDLELLLNEKSLNSTIGIGHTRWATHGEPNDVNAHPHRSNSGRLAMIHNGIIENYASLKQDLIKRGYTFHSETDTEVFVNFVEHIQKENDLDIVEALRIALSNIVGAYAVIIISEDEPDKLVAARKASPLVVGIGEDEFFLASDATPIVAFNGVI